MSPFCIVCVSLCHRVSLLLIARARALSLSLALSLFLSVARNLWHSRSQIFISSNLHIFISSCSCRPTPIADPPSRTVCVCVLCVVCCVCVCVYGDVAQREQQTRNQELHEQQHATHVSNVDCQTRNIFARARARKHTCSRKWERLAER